MLYAIHDERAAARCYLTLDERDPMELARALS
jgi:hypothetical protein